ncbi:hypothetical protein GLOIN_2v1653257 [Rhizophagus clarus]|uniref:Uncharacterized protein n=1 Tax=Rhizophagus clarus TaxID=94130 RepID=A0A8H3R4M1_9GLOM|nr:hypothetical protein GLOIN_2v1653257 [Rhizophagus clarus]
MGEKINNKFCDTIQDSKNCNPVRSGGYYGKPALLSSPSSDNGVGCAVSLMDTLPHESYFAQKNEIPKNEKIPFQTPYQLVSKIHVDGECAATSNNVEYDVFGEKKEDQSVHVRCFNTMRSIDTKTGEKELLPHQRSNCGLESEGYINAIKYCPNQERIQALRTSLGELCGVGTLDGTVWTEKVPETPCHLVVPDVQSEDANVSGSMSPMPTGGKNNEITGCRNGSKNLLLLVEIIANESDRNRVATSLNCHVTKGDPHICYLQDIKEYGFDHIIIIGNCCCGILFLDCFGRVFAWDSMTYALRSLGDYWYLLTEKPQKSRLVWILDIDGTIDQIEDGMWRFLLILFILPK